jgi:DNA-binding response OmpR family regulator
MRKRVLVVEDEPDVARLLEFHLRAAGFEVIVVGTVAAALARARADEPTVVLLDVMLPDGDGFEVCRALRAEPATAGVGVVMLTARAEAEDRITGLEVGADDYVVKPFVVREVVLRVVALANRLAGERAAPVAAQPRWSSSGRCTSIRSATRSPTPARRWRCARSSTSCW